MIDKYCELLKQWSKSINLVQNHTLNNMVERHVQDSAQIIDLLDKNQPIIDIGSGAGLPGVILSINGFKKITLCENDAKKVAFLRTVRQILKLEYEIFSEDVYHFKKTGYIAVSRAFGSILKLCEVLDKIKVESGVFHKGIQYQQELQEARKKYEFQYEQYPSKTNASSVIIKIWNIKRKQWEQ